MRTIFAFIAAAGALSSVSAHAQETAPAALNIHLVCQGSRTELSTESTSVTLQNPHKATDQATGSASTTRQVQMPGQIDVAVENGVVRVNPSSVTHTSLIFKGSADGWYTLTNVVIDQDQIAGQFKLSAIQNPKVRIDRHTGAIRMNGYAFQYAGNCEKSAEPISAQKF